MAKKTLYDEEGNPVEVDFQDEPDNGPAELRKALKKEKTERENDTKELITLRAELRARSVKEVLDKKGVSEKVAKFIPTDVSTSDQIDLWLTENAVVFGFTTDQPEAKNEVNQENVNNFRRITQATETAIPATKDSDIMAKLLSPNLTMAELSSMRDAGETPQAVARIRR